MQYIFNLTILKSDFIKAFRTLTPCQTYRIIYNNVWEVLHSHQKKAKLRMANMTVILGENILKFWCPREMRTTEQPLNLLVTVAGRKNLTAWQKQLRGTPQDLALCIPYRDGPLFKRAHLFGVTLPFLFSPKAMCLVGRKDFLQMKAATKHTHILKFNSS